MGHKPRPKPSLEQWNSLSERQQETALLLMKGTMSRSEIADTLGLSQKTVDSHRLTLLNRLGLSSTVELAHFGIHHGLIKVWA